ncbi:hypothetical protein [Paraburkholderia caribensis]|uniref:hypothetical protein n=1 Tax=Paraburkholderia caribensis TaxID=75105 RepID=UPI001CB1BE23|nr:hypothetical protein [Paraburkholderia caribensis]CAG9243904.1 hypothetical protein PCAR4_140112 [Paraburkholderia caribensis]
MDKRKYWDLEVPFVGPDPALEATSWVERCLADDEAKSNEMALAATVEHQATQAGLTAGDWMVQRLEYLSEDSTHREECLRLRQESADATDFFLCGDHVKSLGRKPRTNPATRMLAAMDEANKRTRDLAAFAVETLPSHN